MQNLIRTFVLLSQILVIGCAGPSGKSFDSPVGEWNSQIEPPYGAPKSTKLTIIDETRATYTWRNGRIFFYSTDERGRWEGYWVEDSGQLKCSEKKDGSINWGVSIFQFNEAYNKFTGEWDSCGDGQRFGWDGSR
jgi:hypothetical protein